MVLWSFLRINKSKQLLSTLIHVNKHLKLIKKYAENANRSFKQAMRCFYYEYLALNGIIQSIQHC